MTSGCVWLSQVHRVFGANLTEPALTCKSLATCRRPFLKRPATLATATSCKDLYVCGEPTPKSEISSAESMFHSYHSRCLLPKQRWELPSSASERDGNPQNPASFKNWSWQSGNHNGTYVGDVPFSFAGIFSPTSYFGFFRDTTPSCAIGTLRKRPGNELYL
ncbi:hypothetical protein K504DRAFT_502471 [Pleomassaria siparia CBS 279.74]|uniref:Uncharacterized protein n=1 Tax=Pleomassaria siparia CBS 279.74 TaxID=1314801 RepID=A0A6G1KBL9_9PLEO|nr:hypothetical protein K504DRAFT_502471 [Pleomassaria siparia CBS 279.74]